MGAGLQHLGLAQGAFGGHADQFVRDLANTLFQLGLFRLPRAAAQFVQQALFVAIARQQFDVLDRQEQPIPTRVFQRDTFMRRAHRGDGLKPVVPPDPVFHMHDQITGRQGLRFGQEILGAPPFARPTDQPVAQHILFGNHSQVRRGEPVLKRPNAQEHTLFPVHIAKIAHRRDAKDVLIL